MAKSPFAAYYGNAGFSGGSSKSGTLASRVKKYYLEDEDEEEKKRIDELAKIAEKDKAKAKTGVKDIVKGAAGAVGGAAKGLWEGVSSSYKQAGKGLGNLAYEVSGGRANEEKFNEQTAQSFLKTKKSLIDKMNKATDPAQKARYKSALDIAKDEERKFFDRTKKGNEEQLKVLDPTKNAAAITSVYFDLATLGTGSRAIKASGSRIASRVGFKAATNAGTTTGVKTLSRLAAQGAFEGGVAGGLNAYQENGKDTKASDLIKGATIGAALGSAIPLGSRAVAKGKAGVTSMHAVKSAEKQGSKLLSKFEDSDSFAKAYQDAIDIRKTGKGKLTKEQKDIIGIVENHRLNRSPNMEVDTEGAFKDLASGDARLVEGGLDTRTLVNRAGSKTIDALKKYSGVESIRKSKIGQGAREAFFEKNTKLYDAVDTMDASRAEKDLLKKDIDFSLGNSARGVAARELGDTASHKEFVQDLNRQSFTGKLDPRRRIYDDVSDFTKARHENYLMDIGVKDENPTLRKTNDEVLGRYDEAQSHYLQGKYDQLKAASQERLDFLHKEGRLTDEQYQGLKDNPDYIRVQRELDPEAPDAFSGPTNAPASSTNNNSIFQKTGKSQNEMVDPIAAYLDFNNKVGAVIDKQRAGKAILPALERAGIARETASAEKAMARQDIYKFLSDTRPGRDMAQKVVGKYKKEFNIISRELGSLNERGRAELSDELNAKLDDLTQKGLLGDTPSDPNAIMSELMNTDTASLRRIKAMVERRDKKLGNVFSALEDAKNDLEAFKTLRGDAWKELQGLKDEAAKFTPNEAGFMVDGVVQKYELPKNVAEVIKGQQRQTVSEVERIFAMPTNFFKALTTGINAAFGSRNIIRDPQAASLYARNPEFLKNFGKSLAQSFGDSIGVGNNPKVQKYLLSEGDSTFLNLTESAGKITKQAKKTVLDQARQEAKGTAMGKARIIGQNYFSSPIKAAKTLANISEQTTRLASYQTAYDSAITRNLSEAAAHREGILAARNNSIDFYKGGKYAKQMNIFMPYLNPAIQGSRKFMTEVGRNPAKMMSQITTRFAAPVAVATAWNLQNEDTQRIYADIPEAEKSRNLIFVLPGMNKEGDKQYNVVKIPLAPGFSDFVQPVRRVMEAGAGVEPLKFADITRDLIAPFSPFGNANLNQIISQTALGYPLTKAVAEPMFNKNFYYNQDIVQGDMQDLPPEEQVYSTTSGTARQIGKALNTSPLKVQQGIRGVLGGGANLVLNTADQIQKGRGAKNPDGSDFTVGGKDFGDDIAGGFTKARGGELDQQFFEQYNKTKGLKEARQKQINKAIANEEYGKAQRKAQEYNDELARTLEEYLAENGRYVSREYLEMLDNLRIDVQVSKKGRPYIKR